MEDTVLSELGAGACEGLDVVLNRGRLVALDGEGSTAVVVPPPLNRVDNELPAFAV